MTKRKTVQQFIDESIGVHGNKYDYSNVVYHGVHTKVAITCYIHGRFEQLALSHLAGRGCRKCGKVDTVLTNMQRYGGKSPMSSSSVKGKLKQTNLEKYGVDNPRKNKLVQSKIKQTWLSKYGVDNPGKHQGVREKYVQTCLVRYGVPNVSQDTLTQLKKTVTSHAHYGVLYPKQHHMRDVLPLIENYDWLFDQYVMQRKTAVVIAHELDISDTTINEYLRFHEITIRYSVGYSYSCVQWLTHIMKTERISIQHALNGGEYAIPGTRYRADGYCKETNTIYEFHGDIFHGNPDRFTPNELCNPWSTLTAGELYQNTLNREELIKSLGYNLIVMWENQWNNIDFSDVCVDNILH